MRIEDRNSAFDLAPALYVMNQSGGPAVCAAPAGSRSDKKPRHAASTAPPSPQTSPPNLGNTFNGRASYWRRLSLHSSSWLRGAPVEQVFNLLIFGLLFGVDLAD
jgi:hypothetical protein